MPIGMLGYCASKFSVYAAAQAPALTLALGSVFVALPSIDQVSAWLSIEPSDASMKRSPATIGIDASCAACVATKPATPTATEGRAIVTGTAPVRFALLRLLAVTVRVAGSEVRPEERWVTRRPVNTRNTVCSSHM